MMNSEYISAIKKIALAYIFIYIDINLATLSILPVWGGYLLIGLALPEIAKKEPSAGLLKNFCAGLGIYYGIDWVMTLMTGGGLQLYWIGIFVAVISLYFHFQLLTNLAQTAENEGISCAKRIRIFRTFQTLLITIHVFADIWLQVLPQGIQEIVMTVDLFIFLALAIGLFIVLRGYAKALAMLPIPSAVREVLARLCDRGYEAFVVGGCVRDLLMGKTPADWDVCTSAKPAEIKACFEEYKTIDTGIKHGTVTVICQDEPVEVTTYRIDGDYNDGRHPDAVTFTSKIEEDLARRDFTVNAMAYSPERDLVDVFGGRQDIETKRLRCVGEPAKRFAEDALRIMRGLRFSAVLGFAPEEETAAAMKSCCSLVDKVSRERVNVELSKLLLGFDTDRVLADYGALLRSVIDGLQPAAVSHLPENLSIRLAAVFPENTEQYLRQLKYSNQIVREASAVSRLAAGGEPPRDAVKIKKILAAEGEAVTGLYFAMFGETAALEKVLDSGSCFSLEHLAVSGDDLIEAGVPAGRAVGEMLSDLLALVIEEKLDNDRAVLLQYVQGRTKV